MGGEWELLKGIDDVNQINEEGRSNDNFFIYNTPIFNLNVKYIQLKVEISNSKILLKSLLLNFFSPGILNVNSSTNNLNKKNSLSARTQSCPCLSQNFISRAEWGCVQAENCPVYDPNSGTNKTHQITTVTHLVVHHAAGYDNSPYDARLRDIWNLHVNMRGFSDIGYNWLIAPNGVIYKGRAWNGNNDNVTGAHTCGCNSNKMGVCLLGDFTNSTPTIAAYNSLVSLLGWKACDLGINVNLGTTTGYNPNDNGTCIDGTLLNLMGHRDGCKQSPLYTVCPGMFYPQLPTLRSNVQSFIDNCSSGCTAPPNDICSSTVPQITVGTTCSNILGDISCSTQSNPSSGCPSGLIQDVWYRFTATSTGIYTARLTPSSGMDGVVEVRQGSCTGTVLGCADVGGGNGAVENLNVSVSNGTTYYLRVYEYNSAGNTTPPTTTSFNICVIGSTTAKPDLTITAGTQSVSSTTVAAGASITASASEDNSGTATAVQMMLVYGFPPHQLSTLALRFI